MELKCPFAEWRPLSVHHTEPVIGTPRILIFHTMVGSLAGTESLFKRDGYSGNESTFGLGGDTDGAKDGALYQWDYLNRQADAQWDGNAYATSVEMSDGGNPNHPLSAKQINTLVRFGVWWCRNTGNPPQWVTSPSGKGFGYHRQFKVWNRNGHSCPGDVRLHQLQNTVVPRIRNQYYRVHVVKAGDSLQSISAQWYGVTDRWRDIWNANRAAIGPDPDLILPGMRLNIPA